VSQKNHHTSSFSSPSSLTFSFPTEPHKLLAWGFNGSGQLGVGDKTDRELPTVVSFFNNHKLTSVACGNNHALALCGEFLSLSFFFAEHNNKKKKAMV
jgi:alpha-tubulin suppressor-like RCC1 family protein